jgi:hypothetical protein
MVAVSTITGASTVFHYDERCDSRLHTHLDHETTLADKSRLFYSAISSQTVLTLWTVSNPTSYVDPSSHAHSDFYPTSPLGEEVLARYYVVLQ